MKKSDPANSSATSLDKALNILETIADQTEEISLTNIANKTQSTPATTLRLLSIFEKRGYVFRNAITKGYSLGLTLIHQGEIARRNVNLIQIAQEILQQIAKATGETASLNININNRSTIMEQVIGNQSMSMTSTIGAQVHLHASASGKVLLSGMTIEEIDDILNDGMPVFTERTINSKTKLMQELEQVSEQGFALDNEERFVGVKCVASPVRDHTGKIVAALHVSVPESRYPNGSFSTLITPVVQAGKELSVKLGWRS